MANEQNVVGKDWLAAMEAKWAEQLTRAASGSPFAPKPVGFYDAQLSNVKLELSKKGEPMVTWDWDIEAGDLAGQSQRDWDRLDRNDGFYWLGLKFAMFGYDPTELAAVGPAAMLEVIKQLNERKPHIQFQIKASKELDASGNPYLNFYITKVHTDDELSVRQEVSSQQTPNPFEDKTEPTSEAAVVNPPPQTQMKTPPPTSTTQQVTTAASEPPAWKQGMRVTFVQGDSVEPGTIQAIDEEDKTIVLKTDAGKMKMKSWDEITLVPEGLA
jgi:hypothetical protein